METETKLALNDNLQLINKKIELYQNSKIVIMGAASCGNLVYNWMKFFGKKIEAFLDNDAYKKNKIFVSDTCRQDRGIKCYTPEDFISNANETYVYVIATGGYLYDLLKTQIEGLLEKYNKSGAIFTCDEYFFGDNYKLIEDIYHNYFEDGKSKDIFKQVISARIANDITSLKYIFEPNAYFCLPEFQQQGASDEVFVDCGAYVGDTIEKYLFNNGYLFKKIYAFEPCEKNYNALKKRVKRLNEEWAFEENKIEIINKGVGDIDTKLFLLEGTIDRGGSFISENSVGGNVVCNICSLDNNINGKVSFIKADIEGYEYKMLNGAKKLILENKPKLAISIYHSPVDLFYIAYYLKKLVPEYKMKVRHHSISTYETILYCYI